VTTLVIDRNVLPEPLLSFIGAERIMVEGETDRIVLTPAGESCKPGSRRINPDDYGNAIDYLEAIPGMMESIMASVNAPKSERIPSPKDWIDGDV
jgi:hypothetical protein